MKITRPARTLLARIGGCMPQIRQYNLATRRYTLEDSNKIEQRVARYLQEKGLVVIDNSQAYLTELGLSELKALVSKL